MGWSSRYRAQCVEPLATMADPAPDPDPAQVDAAFDAEERAAVQAEGAGTPTAPVLHAMPCSWSDPEILPTQGARCRSCGGSTWWCEAVEPRGWRCAICYRHHHLPADRRREIRT